MKKLITITALAAVAALTGCQSTTITRAPDGELKVSVFSHMFKREIDSFKVTKSADGDLELMLNGYGGDTSEQLSKTIGESLAGLAVLGRLAAAAHNPAVAAVPLTPDAAEADGAAKIVTAHAEGRARVAAAKSTQNSKNCVDGSCGEEGCKTCSE